MILCRTVLSTYLTGALKMIVGRVFLLRQKICNVLSLVVATLHVFAAVASDLSAVMVLYKKRDRLCIGIAIIGTFCGVTGFR